MFIFIYILIVKSLFESAEALYNFLRNLSGLILIIPIFIIYGWIIGVVSILIVQLYNITYSLVIDKLQSKWNNYINNKAKGL